MELLFLVSECVVLCAEVLPGAGHGAAGGAGRAVGHDHRGDVRGGQGRERGPLAHHLHTLRPHQRLPGQRQHLQGQGGTHIVM